jgi:hypothetical protein
MPQSKQYIEWLESWLKTTGGCLISLTFSLTRDNLQHRQQCRLAEIVSKEKIESYKAPLGMRAVPYDHARLTRAACVLSLVTNDKQD